MTPLTTKTDWTYTDFMSTQWQRYLSNVEAVRNALPAKPTTPQTPLTLDRFTYEQANDIEKILVDTEELVVGMQNWVVFSGVSRSGQPRLWQHRFRDLYEGFDTTWGDFSSQTWADLFNVTWDSFNIGG